MLKTFNHSDNTPPEKRWPDYAARARLDATPERCAGCGREGAGLHWTHYRLIPGAPALGCAMCGHIEYVTHRVYVAARAGTRVALPKAAEGAIHRKLNKTHRSRRPD